MKLNCYKIKCKTSDGEVYEIGVMTTDKKSAMHSAEHTLLEGKHIKVTAIDVVETNGI